MVVFSWRHVYLNSFAVSVFCVCLIVGVRGEVPQRVSCSQCGYVLFEGLELTAPDEIIQRFDGRCPKCGKKLSFEHGQGHVDIKPCK